jgi:hypothetical protein
MYLSFRQDITGVILSAAGDREDLLSAVLLFVGTGNGVYPQPGKIFVPAFLVFSAFRDSL